MRKIIFYLSLLLLFISSCKARKNKNTALEKQVISDTATKTKEMSASDWLKNSIKPWKYFSSKMDIEQNVLQGFSKLGGNIRMYKDSLVWISVNMIGIEGARVLINKDSMVLMDKFAKTYTVYKKEMIQDLLGAPLNVSQIQNLIIAKPIYALELYSILNQDASRLDIQALQPLVYFNHYVKKDYLTIDSTYIKDRTNRHYAMVEYKNYEVINGHNFPKIFQLKAYDGKKIVDVKLEFESPDFVTETTFPFNIPSSYERK